MRKQLLAAVKERLREALGDRLKAVILYGSEARGEARPDSDIDVMVVLGGELNRIPDFETINRAIWDLQYAYRNRYIECWPVSEAVFEAQEFALYRNARREGVVA